MQNLRNLTENELAGIYSTADEATQAAVLREATRRDRKDAQTARDKARWAAVNTEWMSWAHAQFIAAEGACRGYLLNKAGQAEGMDPWLLWTGPISRVTRYASEELLEFWESNRRLTVSEYRAELRRANREQLTG